MKIASLIFLFAALVPAWAYGQPPVARVDYERLVSRADLVYDEPAPRSEAGMPVGNGRMGSLVWTSPSAIRFQINRNDVFANNSASNNFYQRNTDYCGGTGFADIDFGRAVFTGQDFRQKLSCYDGLVSVQHGALKASVMAWSEADVMAVHVEGAPEDAGTVRVDLRMLRDAVSLRGNHKALSKVSVVDGYIVLGQQFTEDDYYCGSAVVIGVQGAGARAELANESTSRLMLHPGAGPFTVYIATAAGFDAHEDLVAAAIKKLRRAEREGFERMLASHKAWWHQFWRKGFVQLHSADGVADNVEKYYTYYLYVMASSSRGKYPTKFNGMLWTTGGDTRQWGALYWGANQSCLYNALFASNRLDLLRPMFDMYTGMYDRCALAARQQWGSKGIYIPETVGFDGPEPLPQDIAREMRALYLVQKPWRERSQAFKDYAYTKLPYLSRWNWKLDGGWHEGRWLSLTKDSAAFGHTSHILSRSAKIAYKYWLYYQYTRDTAWLRKYGYPMLKGVAEFYRNFPNVKKESDGKYHIYHVNDNEALWDGLNTAEEISAMMGIFPVVIEASGILKTDEAMRPVWQEFLNHLSPLPARVRDGKTVWMKSLAPVFHGNPEGLPDGNTMPAWYFDLCNSEAGSPLSRLAENTFDAFYPHGISATTRVGVLSRLPVAGIRLGHSDATRYLIPNQLHTEEAAALPNRMDQREGRQTTNVERLGRAAEALQEALVQSVPGAPGEDPVIYVFSAWPSEWDARFELLCRGNFLVSASMEKGAVSGVAITAQSGGVCRISNPWPAGGAVVYKNGKQWKRSSDKLIVFTTKAQDVFHIRPRKKG
jgi:hypothetical protein